MISRNLEYVIFFSLVVIVILFTLLFLEFYRKPPTEFFDDIENINKITINDPSVKNQLNTVLSETPQALYGEIDILDDGMNGNAGLHYNLCSKSCCSLQYPPPYGVVKTDPQLCNSKTEFVASNYVCNNGWQDTGCLC